jgi:two-component system response regulator FixJ
LQFLPTSDLFIVDDDAVTRDALSAIFALAGYHVTVFAEAEKFIAAARAKPPAGVLLGLHLSDKSGLAVLKEINAKQYPAPILIISHDGNVACAVDAVKGGAFDYLVKPFEAGAIVASVNNAIAAFAKLRVCVSDTNDIVFEFSRDKLLTPREHEVLAQIAAGATNKEAGRRLAISPRTIEAHRARVMEKIGARNAADLMRIVLSGNSKNASAASSDFAT